MTAITVDNGTASWTTGYTNQDHIAHTSDGTQWAMMQRTPTSVKFSYSTNEGDDWSASEDSTLSNVANGSFFIDADDNATVVYRNSDVGIYLIHGVLNAAGNAWVWGTPTSIAGGLENNYPTHVTFRDPANPGQWITAIVSSASNANINTVSPMLYIVSIDASYGITLDNSITLETHSGTTLPLFPTLDFHHDGDHKTVADSLPTLYIGWTTGTFGTDYGVFYSRVEYSAGTFTASAAQGLTEDRYNPDINVYWMKTHYSAYNDMVYLVGYLHHSEHTDTNRMHGIMILMRDEANTTSDLFEYTQNFEGGSSTIDQHGNIYIVGYRPELVEVETDINGESYEEVIEEESYGYRKFSWPSTTITDHTELLSADNVAQSAHHSSAKRGVLNATDGPRSFMVIFTDNTTSPYDAKFIRAVDINSAPLASTFTGETHVDRTEANRRSWTFNDSDTSDTQVKYEYRWKVQGAGTWNYESGVVISENGYIDIAADSFPAGTNTIVEQVKTYDADNESSDWAENTFTSAETTALPVITDPASDGDTVATQSYAMDWTATDQTHYQIKIFEDSSGAVGTELFDSGITESTDRTYSLSFPQNGATQHIGIRVKGASGLWSDWVYREAYVNYNPPATPIAEVSNADTARLTIAITHPTPSGSQAEVESLDIYRRIGATGTEMRIAAGVTALTEYVDWAVASGTDYQYKVVAVGTNDGRTDSGWAS